MICVIVNKSYLEEKLVSHRYRKPTSSYNLIPSLLCMIFYDSTNNAVLTTNKTRSMGAATY